MSISEREQEALDHIEDAIVGSDRGPASLLARVTPLNASQEMPVPEKLQARCRSQAGSSGAVAGRGRSCACGSWWPSRGSCSRWPSATARARYRRPQHAPG